MSAMSSPNKAQYLIPKTASALIPPVSTAPHPGKIKAERLRPGEGSLQNISALRGSATVRAWQLNDSRQNAQAWTHPTHHKVVGEHQANTDSHIWAHRAETARGAMVCIATGCGSVPAVRYGIPWPCIDGRLG